jgi:hypothetical protein
VKDRKELKSTWHLIMSNKKVKNKKFITKNLGLMIAFLALSIGSINIAHAAPGGLGRELDFGGRLIDSTNQVVQDGTYRLRLRFFDDPVAGSQLYEELFDETTDYGSGACPAVPVQDGFFRVVAGSCNVVSDTAFKALYNNTEMYAEISIDTDEDGAFEEVFSPRRRIGVEAGAVSALQLVSSGTGTSSNTLYIDGQGHLQFDGVGRFGLGISGAQPQSTIEAYDASSTSRLHLYGAGDGFTYSEIRLGRDSQGSASWNLYHREVGGETGNFAIEEFDGSNYNQRLVINPGGNIGIGTIAPAAKVQIFGNNSGGVFDALRITNAAGSGQSQISFEESGQGQNFSIRYNGSSNQLEFIGLGGNVAFEIDRDDGDVFTQGDLNVGNDINVSGGVIVDGSIVSGSGALDIVTSGNNDINLSPGAGGDVNLVLNSDSATNDNCFEIRNDGNNRVRYNCATDDFEINNANLRVGGRSVFVGRGVLTSTATVACSPVADAGFTPGFWLANNTNCDSMFIGSTTNTDGSEQLGFWIDGNWRFSVDRAGRAYVDSWYDTDDNNYYIDPSATSRINNMIVDGNLGVGVPTPSQKLDVAGNIRTGGNIVINNSSPTTYYQDTDHRSAMIHVNGNVFYVLRGCEVNSLSWCATGGYWPFSINLENNAATFGGNLFVAGALSKTSGTFDIKHPDPVKQADGWRLRHSFVESPTRGDNIYRFEVEVKNGEGKHDLPSYFQFLNENSQVWLSPVGHFGRALGKVNNETNQIDISADTDGLYNALVIGTRKDEDAQVFEEKGVEYQGEPAPVAPDPFEGQTPAQPATR